MIARRNLRLLAMVFGLAAPGMAAIACNAPITPSIAVITQSPDPVPLASPTLAATETPSPSPEPTATETPIPTATPFGCSQPIDDMMRVAVAGGYTLNQRTVSMLEQAQVLYGGTHELLRAVTQGSYNIGVDASFGTHDGGGAVDLSLRDLQDFHHILYEEEDVLILALREAGFAAWVRDQGALYPDSPIHIHAIAVGDPELSPAAEEQLTGPVGYFRGYNGLPDLFQADPHGGPIVCPWMEALGYRDLRSNP